MEARQNLRSSDLQSGRPLDIDEVRLVADLRIMHSKVEELYQVVMRLKQRHPESDIRKYADQSALETDIHEVDQIYLWLIGLKKE
ncbi:MAG TPA: hypothetical protein VFA60_05870 [Terriglobales bacterium]|nr:hypothetical protein [Terriglobales bacterium]